MKIGVIGMSEGNGHPYSWSAICNGYDKKQMADCPFPGIPDYLEKETWPDARIPNVQVTHVWSQNLDTSKHIAAATFIPNICENIEDMIGEVDAIFLARDDAENHSSMAKIFIENGLPIFIDKPFSTVLDNAKQMLSWQKYDSQIFTCSALKYAKELKFNINANQVTSVKATTPKYWETYGVHLLDPILQNFPDRGKLLFVEKDNNNSNHNVKVSWENIQVDFICTGSTPSGIHFSMIQNGISSTFNFVDSFSAFKKSIEIFLSGIKSKTIKIPRRETLEIVEILERGK